MYHLIPKTVHEALTHSRLRTTMKEEMLAYNKIILEFGIVWVFYNVEAMEDFFNSLYQYKCQSYKNSENSKKLQDIIENYNNKK